MLSPTLSTNDEKLEFIDTNQKSPGIYFQEAIRDRYLSDEEAEYFVGLKKAEEYCKKISTLSLEGMGISACICKKYMNMSESFENSSFSYDKICSLCLDNNLLNDWNSLFCILSHLPKLEYLTINGNQFKETNCPTKYRFDNIKVLSMSKTFVEFEYLMTLLGRDSIFPNVNYLNISSNNYTHISIKCVNSTVQKLDLSLNMLSDWEMMKCVLTRMPGLNSLNISDNCFMKLPILKLYTSVDMEFPRIVELNLDNCGIKELGTIIYLRKAFPNLEHLSIRKNDVLESNIIDMRSIIISLIPNIKTFNKSIISKQDITSYQRYYISQYTVHKNGILKEVDPNGDILCEFVMINDLIVDKDLTPKYPDSPKNEKYLDISFIPQCKSCLGQVPARIKINKNMAISDVKVLIWKMYKIQKNESLEYIFVNNKTKIPIDGYSDSYSLADIGIETSGKIYIQDL
ncbi:LRR repeats protein [Cryptosporidium canis]|uniref:LRR repeats protein n=1 Tax=Cryptosporidium canis TaxID=195482 RepID=A0ABQ8PB43_9CRYT|nr:LRR repeats protein [Cryptosporidium canis]KAJ1615155.1 LRR repeats protein [Cryptosporidium canis]